MVKPAEATVADEFIRVMDDCEIEDDQTNPPAVRYLPAHMVKRGESTVLQSFEFIGIQIVLLHGINVAIQDVVMKYDNFRVCHNLLLSWWFKEHVLSSLRFQATRM